MTEGAADTKWLVEKLKGKWGEVIKATTPSREVASKILGGAECREVVRREIEPALQELSKGYRVKHLILVGVRGSGKTHWCYHIESLARKHGIKTLYISVRSALIASERSLLEHLESVGINVRAIEEPVLLLLDELDEILYVEAGVSRLRERFIRDLAYLVDIADHRPLMLTLASLPRTLEMLSGEALFSKLFGATGRVELSAIISDYRRARVVWLDKFWLYKESIEDKTNFLIDVAHISINYELEKMGEKGVDISTVKSLLDESLWEALARVNTSLDIALTNLKEVFKLIDDVGVPVKLEHIEKLGFTKTLKIIEELEKHRRSYSNYPTRDRMMRVAKNIAVAFAKLFNAQYSIDRRIPPTAKSGWVQVTALIQRGGERIALLVPQFDKALYIADVGRFSEKISKLLEGGHVDRILILVPASAASKARGLIAYPNLGKWIAEGKLGIIVVDEEKHLALISNLEAIEWDDTVKRMVGRELESLRDPWGAKVLRLEASI